MNPAAISNLSNTYLQSFLGNLQGSGSANGTTGSSSLQSSKNGSAQDSTFADLIGLDHEPVVLPGVVTAATWES
jgi:hypothetical protein